jgi:hypothetical protein
VSIISDIAKLIQIAYFQGLLGVMITDVHMTVDWRTRDFLCAALLISFGDRFASAWFAEWLLSNGRG